MAVSRDQRVRMERAHVLAWPALRTALIDGWLWRSSGGGSQRANSVSTIDFHAADPQAALDDVEARYRARSAPARFHTYDETSPPALPETLRSRGYRETEPTITMFKRSGPAGPLAGAEVEQRDHPWPEWQSCYMAEISDDRRAVNAEILERIPQPRAFFGHRRGGLIVATALGVAGFGCAVVECVATRVDARRQGAAQALLHAVQIWAVGQQVDLIGLQVVATNLPAVALYRQNGFVAAVTNRFWMRP